MVSRWTKVWIFICLLFLLVWTLYWTIPSSLERLVELITGTFSGNQSFSGWLYIWMEVSGAIGTIMRNFGILFGIFALFMISKMSKGFVDVKNWVGIAMFFEAFYYFMVGFPSGVFMTSGGYGGVFVTLGISYFLQFLFTVPFLLILGLMIIKGKHKEDGFPKWVGLTLTGYILALVVNSMFRWIDMGLTDLFAIVTAFILLILAVLLSVIAGYKFMNKSKKFNTWLGLALLVIGLYYLFYLIFTYLKGMIGIVLLVEVWAISLIGLGISIMKYDES